MYFKAPDVLLFLHNVISVFCANLLIGGLEFARPINYAKLNNKFAFTSNLALNM